jgi:hypothetical protein
MFRFKSIKDLDAEEGTVKLVDGMPLNSAQLILATHHFKSKGNTDIILVPQPSDDVNDPLNWPKWKRATAFLSICFFSFLASWVLGGITLGIPAMIREFHVDLSRAIHGLVSWVVLILGVAVSPPNSLVDVRTSFGLQPLSISADGPSSSFVVSFSSGALSGRRERKPSTVLPRLELSRPLQVQPLRDSLPLLSEIYSSFMNAAGGWAFTFFSKSPVLVLVVSCLDL